MRVLIAGCGYVGTALGERLAAEGHEVFGLRRNPEGLPPPVEPVAADLSTTGSLREALPGGLDLVFYTASPGGSTDEAYELAYVTGPRNLLAALRQRGESPRRVVFTTSTGVYGQSDGEWVDETSPTEPERFSGRRLLEGERTVLGGPFPAVVLRLGGIYGPGRTRAIDRAREAPPEDEPPAYTNRIHRDDCAGALRHLSLLEDPEPVYLGVDHEPADRRVVAEWLAARRPAPAGEEAPAEAEPRARGPFRGGSGKRCSNARLVASGYTFRYPTFREGFADLMPDT